MRVLVVGAGGLGCPALLALADQGVSAMIFDPDRVELSNIHRQLLYAERDIGRLKIEVAIEQLAALYPHVPMWGEPLALGPHNLDRLCEFDLVLDGTDRFETKLMLADAAIDRGVRFVFAGVVGYEGQVLAVLPGVSACPRCLFDEAPPPGAAPTCAELGILGPVAGVVAARQVEVGLELLRNPHAVTNLLWCYDGRRDRVRELPLRRVKDCRGCGSERHLRGVLEGTPEPGSFDAPEFDLSGFLCPETFIQAHRRLYSLSPGERLWLRISGDEARRSVPASVRAAGHRVIFHTVDGSTSRVLVERASDLLEEDRP